MKGQLRYQVQFLPRIDNSVLEVLEATGTDKKLNEFLQGIMNLNIIEAKDLSVFQGIYPQLLCILFFDLYLVYINGKKVFETSIKKMTSKPYWNEFFEYFTEDYEASQIEFVIIDSREKVKIASYLIMGNEIKDLSVFSIYSNYRLGIVNGMN